MRKCETCVVNASCTKKEHEGTLCKDVFESITKKIEFMREEADRLESLYGLISYYYHKKTSRMTTEHLMEISIHEDRMEDLNE